MTRPMMRRWLCALAALGCGCATTWSVAERLDRAQRFAVAGDCPRAVEEFRTVLQVEPSTLAAYRGWVGCSARLGVLAGLRAEFQERAKRPGDATARYVLGLVALAEPGAAGAQTATQWFDEAAALAPAEAEFRYRAGLGLLLADQPAEAWKRLAAALEQAPEAAQYYPAAADALFRLGQPAAARQRLVEMLRLEPRAQDLELARQVLARTAAARRGLSPEQSADLDAALEQLDRGTDPSGALEQIEILIAAAPETPLLHHVRGLVQERLGRHPEALISLRRANELAPDWAEPLLGLAAVYGALGRRGEALGHYRDALQRDPLSVAARTALGELHLARGEFDEAVVQFRALVTLSSGAVPPRLWLARALAGAGRRAEAEAELRLVVAADPTRGEALFRLALFRAEAGFQLPVGPEKEAALAEAHERLSQVLALEPKHTGALELKRRLEALPE